MGVDLNFRTWIQGLVKGVQSEREERKVRHEGKKPKRQKNYNKINKLKTKTKQEDTRTPNEVRLETCVTCVE